MTFGSGFEGLPGSIKVEIKQLGKDIGDGILSRAGDSLKADIKAIKTSFSTFTSQITSVKVSAGVETVTSFTDVVTYAAIADTVFASAKVSPPPSNGVTDSLLNRIESHLSPTERYAINTYKQDLSVAAAYVLGSAPIQTQLEQLKADIGSLSGGGIYTERQVLLYLTAVAQATTVQEY